MEFTYMAYERLLQLIANSGYAFSGFLNWEAKGKVCILRHDIDIDPSKVYAIADIEKKYSVSATYFFLLNSNFYNLCSSDTLDIIYDLLQRGHSIGLHFDETRYHIDNDIQKMNFYIQREAEIMSKIIGREVRTISMHRPSLRDITTSQTYGRLVNSYGTEIQKRFKYFSDSRMYWKEEIESEISMCQYPRMQILTHPIWYHVKQETMRDTLGEYAAKTFLSLYANMSENIRTLEDVLTYDDAKEYVLRDKLVKGN